MRDNGFIPAGTYPVGADIWGMPAVGAANVDDLVAVQSTSPPVYKLVSPSSLSAGVSGPESSTDNAIARWDGTDGGTLQDSAGLTWDGSVLSVPGNLRLGSATGPQIQRNSDSVINVTEDDGTTTASIHANSFLARDTVNRGLLNSNGLYLRNDSFVGWNNGNAGASIPRTKMYRRAEGVVGITNDNQDGGSLRLGTVTGPQFNYVDDATVSITEDDGTTLGSLKAATVSMGGAHTATSSADVDDDRFRVRQTLTPASASAAGNQGDIAWDADYLYCCTATNTWKRVAIATW